MKLKDIPIEYRGWWRITETTTWMKEDLDAIGTALISLTGHDDRLRMLYLLANITCNPTKTGVSFTWKGAWEFDQLTGSGRVKLGNDGKIQGVFKIRLELARQCDPAQDFKFFRAVFLTFSQDSYFSINPMVWEMLLKSPIAVKYREIPGR